MKTATLHRSARRGFTLIELLAAIAVLAIMILFLGKVFNDSTRIWKLGNKKIESNNAGRAAIEFMARELTAALCDRTLTLKMDSDADNYLNRQSDWISFVSTASEATRNTVGASSFTQREAKQVVYRVLKMGKRDYTTHALVAHNLRSTKSIDCYKRTDWWTGFENVTTNNSSVLAENVRNFEVFVYDQNGQLVADYDSRNHGPPLWIDIYLEVLAEEDAIKASLLPNDNIQTADSRRYHTRIYPAMFGGYARD